MDIVNFWKETGDTATDRFHRAMTWLCNGSDGQTYPLSSFFMLQYSADEIEQMGYCYDWCDVEPKFDEIVGWKHDYKLDDAELETVARNMVAGLDELAKDVKEHPERYFKTHGEVDAMMKKLRDERQGKPCRVCANAPHCASFRPVA